MHVCCLLRFHFYQVQSYHQQVPARSLSSNAESFLKDFLSEIPIFGILGTVYLVESTAKYSVESNPDVQLVCKYLKAYDTGGERGIDKLFKEGTISMLTYYGFLCVINVKFFTAGPRGRRRSNPVKFSTTPDLPREECQRLLGKYVPDSIKRTKISQQLFLKYVCYWV